MKFYIGDIVRLGGTIYRVTHINPYKDDREPHIGVRYKSDTSTSNIMWGWDYNKNFILIKRADPQLQFNFTGEIKCNIK